MANHNYQNMRFLIVDNIKPSQDILKQFVLRLTNKQVDSTHYAQDVAALCQQKSYDVILLGYDLGEKQKNGQQILEELRVNNYINRQCTVILITAEVSQAMVLAALEHKPDHYLCKPYSLSDLDKRLGDCLRKKRIMGPIYQALDDQQPLKVIKHCQEALTNKKPFKAECLGILSRQYFELEEYDKAKQIYNAYKNTANCQWATIGLGKVALQEQKLHQAEKLFKLLIDKYPLYLSSYDWLAVTYEAQFHYLFAEEVLEQALQISPRSLTRLKKYANLCIKNEHFEKAATAYENNYKLAHNSIHHCADNTLKYVKALIEYSPSLALVDAKKMNTKAFGYMKKMTRDFREPEIKIQSHLLGACLFNITREINLANDEIYRGESLLAREQTNIPSEQLKEISLTLKRLNKSELASEILLLSQQVDLTVEDSEKEGLSLKELAQAEIELSMSLYKEQNYSAAITKLEEAEKSYPNHPGIKLNLLQVLLVVYGEEQNNKDCKDSIKRLIQSLNKLNLDSNNQERLKKLQKKYQLIAGI